MMNLILENAALHFNLPSDVLYCFVSLFVCSLFCLTFFRLFVDVLFSLSAG